MICVKSLSVGERVLPLSFACKPGKVVHVVGPNGSGKSTLLSALAGIMTFQGCVKLDGQELSALTIAELSLYRAYLAQSDKPVFSIPVFQYLSLSAPRHKKASPELAEVISQLSQLLNIDNKIHRSINQLSGGEWQRVRLLGVCLQVWPTLNPEAKLLILDEPSTALDVGQDRLLYQLIDQVAKQGITVIMANHDLNRTLNQADQVLLLDKGVLVKQGSAEQVLQPNTICEVFHTEVILTRVNDKQVLVFD